MYNYTGHTNVDNKSEAVSLRKLGYSYTEISGKMGGVAKSTLSGWLKGIVLTNKQSSRLLAKSKAAGQVGRQIGANTNRQKSLERVANIQVEADEEFVANHHNKLFLIGIALYWAEGNQKTHRFQFTNSNPEMINVMLRWLELVGCEDSQIKFRLYIHKPYQDENCEEYWQKITGFERGSFQKTLLKPTKHNTKKNPDYKGCLKIDVNGSELYWKVKRWEELLPGIICPRSETDITTGFEPVNGGSSPSEGTTWRL